MMTDPESLEFRPRRWRAGEESATSDSPSLGGRSAAMGSIRPATPTPSSTPRIDYDLHRQLVSLRRASRVSGSGSLASSTNHPTGIAMEVGDDVVSLAVQQPASVKRDARYRKLQTRAYNFLERPRGPKAIAYHMVVFIMVFACLLLSVFSTIEEYQESADEALIYMEGLVVLWFTVEFFFRLWSSGCRSRYQGIVGRLKFLRRPFCVIDIVTIVASLVVISLGSGGQVFATSALRGLRFFQILRMVRMDRRGGTWKLLGSVVYAHRQELFTTVYIGFLALIFSSFLMYLAEKEANPEKFSNFADALWWGVITLSTVGYGDAFPVTWQGKLIASGCALMGISFFALPAGILGSGFALKVQQQQRQKHMIRRRQPAASLIQCLWRCCAADGLFRSVATWKVHMPNAAGLHKQNASFANRLPTIRRAKTPQPTGHHKMVAATTSFMTTSSLSQLNQVSSVDSNGGLSIRKLIPDSNRNSSDEDELQPSDQVRYVQLTSSYRLAIRAIRKMKFFVARRKFKEALKPYDVKDVIEQYSAGHVDLLGRVKGLQARLDQILGKSGSKGKDVYDSKHSLASRIVNVERQVGEMEAKVQRILDLCLEERSARMAVNTIRPEGQQLDEQPSASVQQQRPPPPTSLQLKPILVVDRGQESGSAVQDDACSPAKKRVTLQ